MKIIGITGGIGSGKSVVSRLLETMNIPVYDTDKEAKRITSSSPVIKEKLIQKFGKELYDNEELNKKKLASLIFYNSMNLNFVNSVIHPEVFNDFIFWKRNFFGKAFAGIESAILFESGLNKITDLNVLVTAPLELRIERVKLRDNLNKEEILNRIKNQMSEEEQEYLTDYIIYNDNIQALIPQVNTLINQL